MSEKGPLLASCTSRRRILLLFVGVTLTLWMMIVIVIMPRVASINEYDCQYYGCKQNQNEQHISIPNSPRKREISNESPNGKGKDRNDFENETRIRIGKQGSNENKKENELRRIYNDFENECPEKFPTSVPKLSQLNKICSNLNEFKLHGGCDISNCSKCVPPGSHSMPWADRDVKPFLDAYSNTMTTRRQKLKSMLSHLDANNDGPLLLMVFNYGYAYLFFNWVCSVDYNNIIGMRNRTLVITTDSKTQGLVESTGYMAYTPEWLGDDLLKRIDPKAAASFALGGHRWTVSIQIVTLTDLIHLGYDVILQDSDIIWNRDPMPYLMRPQMQPIDIQMTVDGRVDNRGPGNSGFFIVRSNCKTKLFMDTMVSLISLVLVGRSDQILWNILIDEKVFRQMHFETLSTQLFISGFQVNIKKETKRENLPNDHFMVHASWTTDQFDKVEKFWNIDHWYFSNEKCNKYYHFNLLPDLAERKWHIRDKTQPQEAKLKQLGIVRDSSNGTYARQE